MTIPRAAALSLVFASCLPALAAEPVIVTVARGDEKFVRHSEGTAVELKDGRLLLAWIEFTKGQGDSDFFPARIVARTSKDGGRTWGDYRVLAKPEPGEISAFSPNLLRLKDGKLLFVYMRYLSFARAKNKYPPATTVALVSDDDGKTFKKLATILDEQPITVCSHSLKQLDSGRVLLPLNRDLSKKGAADHWEAGVAYSDDGGKTWKQSADWVDAPKRGAMEPHVEAIEGDHLLMVMRTQMGSVYKAESRDGGKTWSKAGPLGVEAPESCPELCKIPGTDHLLLVWNAAKYDPKWASHFGKRTPLSCAVSKDGGRTWSRPRHVETDAGWAFSNPGAYFTSKKTLLLNYWACKYTDKGFMSNYPIDLKVALVETAWLYGEEGGAKPRLPRDRLLLYRGKDGKPVEVKTVEDWGKRRAEVVRGMESVMGRLPGEKKRCALDVKTEEEVDEGTHVRRLITYASEPGSRVPAYLLIPKGLLEGKKKAPAVLCLHGTDMVIGHGTIVGLGKRPNRNYAQELAKRGYVALAPNYPLMAKYQPDLKKLGWESGTLKAVWDNMRGLDLLGSLPFVDTSKGFGAVGHSLGGHNSVYTAVFDERIKAVVSSCGLDSYLDYYGGNEKNWQPERGWCQTRYMRKLAEYRGRLEDIPFDFHEMVGALAPRHVLIIAPKKDSNFRVDSVERIVKAARPVFKLHGHEDRLKAEYPDCGHDFPEEMREAAYKLFDKVLAGK